MSSPSAHVSDWDIADLLHLDDSFQAFLRGLEDADVVWFCFFSTGLLHVLGHFVQFIPPSISFVLLTSALDDDELAALAGLTSHPFFPIAERVDSKAVYELLFRNVDQPFGWVDVDCFVSDSRWFDEATRSLDRQNAVSGAFQYGPIPIAAAPFLVVNPVAIGEVITFVGGAVSPSSYTYVDTSVGRDIAGFSSRVVRDYHDVALREVLVMEGDHLPFPQGGLLDVYVDGLEARSHERHHHRESGRVLDLVFYDGLVLYQLLARAAGLRIKFIRRYPGSKAASAEVVHLGGISYWERLPAVSPHRISPTTLPWSAHLDALLLQRFVALGDPPDVYSARWRRLSRLVEGAGTTMPALANDLANFLRRSGVATTDERWAALFGGHAANV